MRTYFPSPERTVTVVWTASASAYEDGYGLLRREYPELRWVDEREFACFRDALLSVLGARPYTTFIMDDNVFRTPFGLDAPEFTTFVEDPEIMCPRCAWRRGWTTATRSIAPRPRPRSSAGRCEATPTSRHSPRPRTRSSPRRRSWRPRS